MKLIIALFLLTTICVSILATSNSSYSETEPCKDVLIIFARGSGQPQTNRVEDKKNKKELNAYIDEIKQRASSDMKLDAQELVYPALGGPLQESFPYFINAKIGWYASGTYRTSVNDGISSAFALLNKEYIRCPNQRYILGGYSQGAQVMGDLLPRLGDNIKNKIAYVALFGDPRFDRNSFAAQGDHYFAATGILGKRNEFPSEYKGKISSWCKRNDGICEGQLHTAFGTLSRHSTYPEKEISIAANNAVKALKQYYSGFNTKHIQPGSLSEKADVVFAVSSAANMRYPIQDIQANIATITESAMLLSKDTRLGLVQFNNVKYGCDIKQPRNDLLLSNQSTSFIARFNDLFGTCGSGKDDTLGGLMKAIDEQPWRSDARKIIILLDCNTPNDPELVSGISSKHVIDAARAKGVEIDSVIRGNLPTQQNYYSALASAAGGQSIFMPAGTTGDSIQMAKFINQMYSKLGDAPIAMLAEQRPAKPGVSISFNAGGSYDPDGTVSSYEWDFSNDNVVDAITTTPATSHTYSSEYIGLATVRVISNDGGSGMASTQMSISESNPAYIKPNEPINVIAGLNDDNTATLSWQLSGKGAGALSIEVPDTDGYVIKDANGEILGIVDGNTRQVTIVDMPKGQPISFSVEATNSEGASQAGFSNTITIDDPTAVQPPKPSPNPIVVLPVEPDVPGSTETPNPTAMPDPVTAINDLSSNNSATLLNAGTATGEIQIASISGDSRSVVALDAINKTQFMKNNGALGLQSIRLKGNKSKNFLWLLVPIFVSSIIYIIKRNNFQKSSV